MAQRTSTTNQDLGLQSPKIRLSYVSATKNGEYQGLATPTKAGDKTPEELEGGALRAGGMPDIYSRENIGLLVNYFVVGIVYGAFPKTVYPFLSNYLHMDGYQTMAAGVLVSLPWSFKVFIGAITDSFPIFGYRRKPYIVFGWAFCTAILIVMACIPVDRPYYQKGQIQLMRAHKITKKQMIIENPNAAHSGAKYIVLMMLASVGYVIADVACDGVVVEFAQREPMEKRGRTQSMIYTARFTASMISGAIIGFCFNGGEYGGKFDFSLSFNAVMVIFAVFAAIAIPATVFFMPDEKVEGESFVGRCKEMWTIAQQRAIWQIMAFNFFNALFYDMDPPAGEVVMRDWAGVEPINNTILGIVANGMMAISIYLTQKYFLHVSWTSVILGTTLFCIAIDVVVSSLTIYDVVRNQWFYLGTPIVTYFPQAVRFIVSTYVTVEITTPGYEATTYGLITTVHNLAGPFATSISNQISANFDVSQDHMELDTPYVRNQVMYTFIIFYIFKIVSNGWLYILPRQKVEAQELKNRGGSSKLAAVIAFSIAAFALVWSVMTNLMSIYPSTACLKIAGGDGCDKKGL